MLRATTFYRRAAAWTARGRPPARRSTRARRRSRARRRRSSCCAKPPPGSSCCSSSATRRSASWAATGSSPAAPSTRTRARARPRSAPRPCASCARRPASTGSTPAQLVRYSRWITPELLRIRFDTHFFLALGAGRDAVARCDGRECVAERWDTPRALLADYERGDAAARVPDAAPHRAARGVRVRAASCSSTRARTRSGRCCRASCAAARSPGSCCPARPATTRPRRAGDV